MENFLDILKGLLLSGAVVFLYLAISGFIEKYKMNVDFESARFASNTVSNHARISGINSSGKISHHKHSCGAATFKADSLKADTINKETSLIFAPTNATESYVFVPQTRLHGGGWFA